MYRLLSLVVALGLCPMAPVNAGDDYLTYVNDRYGYHIEYPADFLPQGVADAGDGQVFLSPAGDAELRVFASACLEDSNATPAEVIASYLEAAREGRLSVSYRHAGQRFAVVSGHRDGRIYYDKVFTVEGWCTQFQFTYAREQAGRYDRVTRRIAGSFRP